MTRKIQIRNILWIYILALILMTFSFHVEAKKGDAAKKETKTPVVVITTSMGKIEVELDPVKAPKSTENFLKYVDSKFYDGTIFHRVISSFMIQGGGMTPKMEEKATREPIDLESDNGLTNARGTIAMARTSDPKSATSQFFINVVDNGPRLDRVAEQGKAPRDGYAVFGKVTSGMDVVDKIKDVATGTEGLHEDVPKEKVLIKSIRRK